MLPRLFDSRLVPILALPLLLAATSIPTTKPSIRQAPKEFAREVDHLARVREKLQSHPDLQSNPYIRMELAIADRFINRLRSPATNARQQDLWAKEQMNEVADVLNHAEDTIALVDSGKLPKHGLGPVPFPTGAPVRIEDGLLVTETKTSNKEPARLQPFFFGGYGHFQQIFRDLPNFPALGVTLIQDGRNGPAQGLNPDLSLSPAASEVKQQLQRARQFNVKLDILTSPHYFPAWAVAQAPDMANGSAFNNIDHPHQRKIIETWLTKLAALIKDEPALMSFCLSNEPAYSASGRDQYSAPAWHAFLKDRHNTIDSLNTLYNTHFKTFDEVPAAGWANDLPGKRRAFDWITFNNQHFALWHKWMSDTIHKQIPSALTHAKIMIFFVFDADKLGWGIDPEQFCNATDLAGCDAYSMQYAPVGALDDATSKDFAYHWQVEELGYDLLNSFRNQPVFNSENHPMPNASGARAIPSRQTYSSIWQGALHHQSAQTTWVWEEPTDDSLLDTIYFRPKNIYAESAAQFDLNRLSDSVAAINRAPARVAILYSPPSMYWEPRYAKSVLSAYTALSLSGEKVTFISENQLSQNRANAGAGAHVEYLILPNATHISEPAWQAMQKYKLLVLGDPPKFDEYHRERTLEKLTTHPIPPDDKSLAALLRETLALPSPVKLEDSSHTTTWGIEYRAVADHNALLIPLINLLKKPQTISIKVPGKTHAENLITAQPVNLDHILLNPMDPLLLRVE